MHRACADSSQMGSRGGSRHKDSPLNKKAFAIDTHREGDNQHSLMESPWDTSHTPEQAPCLGGADQHKTDSLLFCFILFCLGIFVLLVFICFIDFFFVQMKVHVSYHSKRYFTVNALFLTSYLFYLIVYILVVRVLMEQSFFFLIMSPETHDHVATPLLPFPSSNIQFVSSLPLSLMLALFPHEKHCILFNLKCQLQLFEDNVSFASLHILPSSPFLKAEQFLQLQVFTYIHVYVMDQEPHIRELGSHYYLGLPKIIHFLSRNTFGFQWLAYRILFLTMWHR